MRTIYLRKDETDYTRKLLLDMAYLVTHNKIRLPKYYFEDSLYLPYFKDKDKKEIHKYFLSKEDILSEDNDFYYFKFPFKTAQVEDAAI